jgi:hypothetical protein
MKQLIFKFIFGADEIAQRMFDLLKLRQAAISQHRHNLVMAMLS